MKHEKGVACFMVPKRGVGRVLARLKTKHEFRRVGWEGFGKAQNEA